MTDTKVRASLKGMSEEDKKEYRKMKNREYMARRRQDPEFAESQRQLMRNYRQGDTYKKYNKIHCAEHYTKTKNTIQELKLKVQILEGH